MESFSANEKKRKAEILDGKMAYEELEAVNIKLAEEKGKLEDEVKELRAENAELKRMLSGGSDGRSKVPYGEVGDDDMSDLSDDGEDKNDPWTIQFRALRDYRIVNGTFVVPKTANPRLKKWVDNQRLKYANVKNKKNGTKITPEHISKLEAIGFPWGPNFPAPVPWDDRFEETKNYKAAMRTDPPVNTISPTPLGIWVSAQRNEYRRFKKGRDSLLTLEQIGQLNDIGFNFNGPRLT